MVVIFVALSGCRWLFVSTREPTFEEFDRRLDRGGRDVVAAAGQDRQLAVWELAVGLDGLLDVAEVISVSAEDQRRDRDLREVGVPVARVLGRALPGEAEVGPPVALALAP